MELSLAGAGIVAQVIPIGVLILAVEARALQKSLTRWPKTVRTVVGWIAAIVVMVGVAGVALCTFAVNDGIGLSGLPALICAVGGFGVYALAGIVAALLTLNAFRGDD